MSKTLYTFEVHNEACPNCGIDLAGDDRVHFKVRGISEWETGAANPPYGEVTQYADEDAPDLVLDTDEVEVSCTKCGCPLEFRPFPEEA